MPVVARRNRPPARFPAARVRLNAITASTSQALLARNLPEAVGKGAVLQVGVALFDDRVPRWVLSAATVSSASGSVLVKNAWNRQSSNSDP